MTHLPLPAAALSSALLALTLLAGCAAAPAAGPASNAGAARTELPGLAAPTGEPDLPSLQGLHPQPGQVVRAAGPFDDRFVVEGLTFDGHAVTGRVRVTSDVSDLLELQVLAGFYDAGGHWLGTARFEQHADGETGHQHAGPPSETQAFSVAAPADLAGTAVSAAVGVPVLVNE